MLESCESLRKSEALRPGQCVQELGGDGGGQEVQLGRVRRGAGFQVVGDEPVAEEGAKLVAVEDSPTTFGFLFYSNYSFLHSPPSIFWAQASRSASGSLARM